MGKFDGPLEPVDTGRRRYTGVRIGTGRWVELPRVGVLWTDDATALQLGERPGADNAKAGALARRLLHLADNGMSATAAFDLIAREHRKQMIQRGNLDDIGW
ncbi:hypothetical protein CH276_22730 [Rhodococcus sp. 06-470-2]|uniref:hypothetical protein n=1 Tax=unclassified Rhodococcus (in: high G+C Gram-positive bacteria) TaxID=192944 RepID=UPI000B9C571A|nr:MULTISPECIES: hypothetical protein [unclassified Rhodococcus (in: high G+C Gram-positive bacteria)]OZC59265.1 hypothetical protein CH276_22730 [Rhodococcus sp. 06-470-2]OZE63631.1 hypothetical protein CH265_12200 [Rhodococcus sp. 05-2221-1B]